MRIRSRTLSVISLIIIITATSFSLVAYYAEKNTLLTGIDEKLLTAARFAEHVVPNDYHDRVTDRNSISEDEYLSIVDTYNQLCKALDLQYIWSLMQIDGRIVFTSGTSPSKDVTKGDQAAFFEVHTNPDAYKEAFETMEIKYSTFRDKWGAGRMVLVPSYDSKGRKHLFAASMRLSEVNAILAGMMERSIFTCGLILLLGMLFSSFLAGSISKPVVELTRVARYIAEGNLDQTVDIKGSAELESLSESVDAMSRSIREKIQELEESRENLSITVNSIGDAVIATDAAGNVTRMNPVAETLTGWTEEEAKGRPLTDVFRIVNTDTSEEVESPVTKVLREGGGVAVTGHTEVNLRDSSKRRISDCGAPIRNRDGEVVGAVLVFRDVTEAYEKDRRLRESEERLSFAMEATNDGLWDWDVRNNQIFLSPRCYTMLGYEPYELSPNLDLVISTIHPDDLPQVMDGFQKHLSGRDDGYEGEFRLKTKTGEWLWVHGRGKVVVRSENGKALRLVGTHSDITERKMMEEERGKLQTQVQHTQKLESLGILAGGIAHDFNNLLMVILGNADLALAELSPFSPGRPRIEEIEKASRRAADLCRQMLAYSGKGRFVVEPVDLNALVREMSHMLEVSISKMIVLKHDFADNLPRIEADATQMRQIVLNLITNASEAIGDKSGLIVIRTGAKECDRAFLGECHLGEGLPEGLYTSIEVDDTGCGMAESTMARFFDPFFTTKFTGRGLGLSAVLGIVRGHKGAILVESELGKGTTFRALFPAANDPVHDAGGPGKDATTSPQFQTGMILVVDDDDSVRGIAKRMLENLGFVVITASDGRSALEVFRERSREILAVVLDLTMPNMDGRECFRELKKVVPDVLVVISSGYTEQDVSQRFKGEHVAGFIHKPYSSDDLAAVITRVLRA